MIKKKKLILITGALGQDGLILSNILLNKKFNVVGLIRNKKYRYYNKKVKYLKINLSNAKQVNKLILNLKPDFIIHFGSNNPSFSKNKKNKKNYYNVNMENTINLINSVIKYSANTTFIFSNSSQILKYRRSKVNEETRFFKSNYYTSFRIDILRYVKKIKSKVNFNFINLILFNHDSIYRNKNFLIPRIIKALKLNNYNFINKIYKENIYEDFSHAEDICNAIYKLIKKGILIDNLILSSGKKTSVNSIIDYLIKKYKKKKFLVKNKFLHNKFIVGDNTLAKKILKWKIKKNIFIAANEMYKKN
jgi:GDPmannose 4,6-dehydratase